MSFTRPVTEVFEDTLLGLQPSEVEAIGSYCTSCGCHVSPEWVHCARCGAQLPTIAGSEPAKSHSQDDGARDLWRTALTKLRQSKFSEAEVAALAFVEKCPDHAEGLALLASVLLKTYRVDEARVHLDRALDLAPDSALVLLSDAQYWLALGLLTRALEQLAKAEAAAADNLPLYHHIRSSVRSLREGNRWSFSRETGLPGPRWVSRLLGPGKH